MSVERQGQGRVEVAAEVGDLGVGAAFAIRDYEVVVVGERAVGRDLEVPLVALAVEEQEVADPGVDLGRRSQTTTLLERPPSEGVGLVLEETAREGHAGGGRTKGAGDEAAGVRAGWGPGAFRG